MNLGRDHARHIAGTAPAQPRSHGNVLFSVDGEGDRIPLNGSSETRLPEHAAGPDIHREEIAVEVSDKGDPSGSGEHARQKRRTLLDGPVFLESAGVVSGQLA